MTRDIQFASGIGQAAFSRGEITVDENGQIIFIITGASCELESGYACASGESVTHAITINEGQMQNINVFLPLMLRQIVKTQQ